MFHATGDGLGSPAPWQTWTDYNWNVARGKFPSSDDSIVGSLRYWADSLGNITAFPYSGDPISGTGYLDGLWKWKSFPNGGIFISLGSGDRYGMLASGPFSLALGDTQEIVLGIIGALGSSGPASVGILKYRTQVLRSIYAVLEEKSLEIPEEPPPVAVVPDDYYLYPNFPNPFNPSTTIEYAIPVDADVRVSIFDVLGREVRILEAARKPAGTYRVVWDGRDRDGRSVSSGIYFYTLIAGHVELSHKLVLVR